MPLGINLCFAVKRMPEPERWAAFVREDLGLDRVQFTFDLLDPWWPDEQRARLARRVRDAAAAHNLIIDSCFVGLAHYVPSGLLDPDADARAAALTWWQRAIDLTAELGAPAVGGPMGTISEADAADPDRRADRQDELVDHLERLARRATEVGVRELLVEPTPILREYPASIDHCQTLLNTLRGRGVDNVGLTLDTGHALFKRLHGADAGIESWIHNLGPRIRQIHLDNTDGRGDPHWGWPHPQGTFDVGALATCLTDNDLADISVILEVYPRFEDDSAEVLKLITSSVEHCRARFPVSTDTQVVRNAAAG
ncbi:sugar phosphate isomerase/epimerase (plasmid) [Amycolatopsis sp. AA4]|uniref:sugar phosphate isomerase/epimerase family protein n=1 Tax=Actinomycetes TaxID=1760 RepID=UPI0001B56174|nr:MULTISPECIES: sugar phosphate isomerase/epimerase [Actinomycetes]ATY16984.1 sugar phosphate isomerase/epimerase [Amycolatopsis sp. AA4]EFL12527.1 xylose isomerase domain-containing protein [Streptomyces sp. AA4]